jgi:hypothetical protein
MSTPTYAFSSARMHDGRKSGEWVHKVVNPSSVKHQEAKKVNLNQKSDNPLKVKCTSHEYEQRKMTLSQVDYLSRVRSEWDQCPGSSSPAHISSPDKQALFYPTDLQGSLLRSHSVGLSLSQIVPWSIETSEEISPKTLGDREISDTSPV